MLEFNHDCVRITPPDFRLLLAVSDLHRSRDHAAELLETVARAVGLRFDEKRLSFVFFPYLQRVLLDTGSGRQRSGTYYPIPAAGKESQSQFLARPSRRRHRRCLLPTQPWIR